MRWRPASAVVGATVGAAFCVAATEADAKCTRLSFTVNDYGKEGPTRDAKNLLDKYIVNWTKEKGIKDYRVGKKDVKCELFLNFIVFDEHTCQASASVCWGDGEAAPPASSEAKTPAPRKKPPSAKKADVPG